VVCSGDGIVTGLPVPISVPPHEPENQCSVAPEPPEAVSVIMPGSSAQKSSRLDTADEGGMGPGSTVTVIDAHVEG
jgi:hypothetical protein